MIRHFTEAIHTGIRYVVQHPQLLMTLVLIVVIPVAFLVSGQQFLNAARDNQERLEKDRIGMMHDLFASFMRSADFDPALIQSEIESLVALNPDITKFRIGKEEGNDVYIIASLDSNQINTAALEPNTYRIGNTNPNESIISPYAHAGVRYWQSFRLVRSSQNDDYYIFIETSLAHIDTLFAERIMTAYYWLGALLIIILLLLIRHVRLIDYAYLYRETRHANEMKDLFTNMIAHELRAPLTAMRGYASMIREREGIDETTKGNASEIEAAAARLVVIVSDLLDVARIQAGKLAIEANEVHLSGLVRSVIAAMQPSAAQKHIDLVIQDIRSDIVIKSDEKRLYQALTNLVSNAIKYTKEGTITIALESLKDRIEIRVKDTGMGISSEHQKKLFAPYFRITNEDTEAIVGTGLGMWITKQLIELMGGSIGVESIKNVGTHVVVTLPILPIGTKS
jgi:signal transduction histidine kinase